MKPQKLSTQEIEEIRASGNAKLIALAAWANKHFECTHCGKCTRRCEVLAGPGLDMGQIEAAYARIMKVAEDKRAEAVVALVTERPELFIALRQCCFCGFCTAACAHHVLAPERMREWRELFMEAGYMPPDDSKLVMVDNEWHIFSAYRAIYGVGYPEFVSLDAAAEYGPGWVDTLFFPGCSLVSYAPEVVRAVGAWLTESGVSWALSDGCCGSPLMSAGLFDRAHALREKCIGQMRAAGITRMITICPGCGEEFVEDMPEGIQIVPLPEVLLELGRERERAAAGGAGVAGGIGEDGEAEAAGEEATGVEVAGEVGEACEVAAGEPAAPANSAADVEPAVSRAAAAGFAPMKRSSLTFFDSCHDRADSRHANAIRALAARYLPAAEQREFDHAKRGTLCCGAGGAVASYDPAITDRRVWRIIDEAHATGAETLVTMCPTCTYTVAQACLGAPDRGIDNHHYLELLFGVEIDWAQVFAQLGDMWTGEYGPWLNATFF